MGMSIPAGWESGRQEALLIWHFHWLLSRRSIHGVIGNSVPIPELQLDIPFDTPPDANVKIFFQQLRWSNEHQRLIAAPQLVKGAHN